MGEVGKPKKVWVTSDWHLGHKNIIAYCSRPFDTVEEMNAKIISNYVAVVCADDVVYFLGDFCFYKDPSEWLKGLPGRIIFIKGNHDRQTFFKHMPDSLTVEYGGKRIRMGHDPFFADVKYPINLCGHVHEKWAHKRVRGDFNFTDVFNVGVDVNNFEPVLLDKVLKMKVKEDK
jgi:calcineurin-like phosphoesterase family protein